MNNVVPLPTCKCKKRVIVQQTRFTDIFFMCVFPYRKKEFLNIVAYFRLAMPMPMPMPIILSPIKVTGNK